MIQSVKTTSQRPAILLFLKAPVPGRVKTRLARDLGAETACGIYCQMVERQLAALPAGWPVELHFSPASARADFAAWLGPYYNYYAQPEGNLGKRMRDAAAGAFERGHRKVILIGGDCPTLKADALAAAAHFLGGGADAVIGPASDGGFYLLGLRSCAGSLHVFEGIPWSTADVARVTIERIGAAGLCLARLKEKEDVDDLPAYRRALAAGHLERRFPAAEELHEVRTFAAYPAAGHPDYPGADGRPTRRDAQLLGNPGERNGGS